MKFIEVKVIQQLKVPQSCRITAHPQDGRECLLLNGRYFMPALAWFEAKKPEKPVHGESDWFENNEDADDLFQRHHLEDVNFRIIKKLPEV